MGHNTPTQVQRLAKDASPFHYQVSEKIETYIEI